MRIFIGGRRNSMAKALASPSELKWLEFYERLRIRLSTVFWTLFLLPVPAYVYHGLHPLEAEDVFRVWLSSDLSRIYIFIGLASFILYSAALGSERRQAKRILDRIAREKAGVEAGMLQYHSTARTAAERTGQG